MAREGVTIVIRKEESGEAGHHGGAWKVAYADFVTAMMAFFLLMWLLNATTEEQRKGLADYFSPTNLFGHSASGSGKPFGGQTPNDAGTATSTSGNVQVINGKRPIQPDVEEDDTDTPALPLVTNRSAQLAQPGTQNGQGSTGSPVSDAQGTGPQRLERGGDYAASRLLPPAGTPGDAVSDIQARAAARQAAADGDAAREQQALEQVAVRLREAIHQDPGLADIASQLSVENVPEGLRIQIVDQDKRSMFSLGNAVPTKRVHDLIQKVVPLLLDLPNAISIAGHTDSTTYRGDDKSNWELSSERANATRRLLVEAGLPDARVRSVTGNADRDLLLPNDPLNPANRRIAIVVLRNGGAAPQ
jgi:chemotaxis protein MotB